MEIAPSQALPISKIVKKERHSIAVDDVGHGPGHSGRHLLSARDLGQGRRKLHEDSGGVGLVTSVLQRVSGVKGGRRQLAIGLEGGLRLGT